MIYSDYACVCKDFGSRNESFYESIGHVNLMNTTLPYCDMCAYARKKRRTEKGDEIGLRGIKSFFLFIASVGESRDHGKW